MKINCLSLRKLIIVLIAVLFSSSCQNTDHYRRERVSKADRAFREIKSKDFPEGAVLSLPYCIKTALNNNLDLRVYELKEAVNNEKRTAAALGMLPDVIVTNDLTYRTNEPGASSYSLNSGKESLEPSKSTQKYENRVRVEFLFSVIDFGLAYFNSVQARDRKLITKEQKRRATQNLILDVTRAYFKVAAAQYAMVNTEKMLKIAGETEKLLEQMVKNKRLPMEKIIKEKKTFLLLKKSLMEYKRSYENSCIELRSLMGYYPTHEIRVDTSGMRNIADIKIPEIELLEEIALLERPELYQLDIRHHITAIAARKKVIEMFPNVGVFTDFTNSTNKYLYNQSWWELGARAAYRLLRVPQQIGEYTAIETEMKQIKAQVTALSVGIISQVRIAHANLAEVKHRYSMAEQLYETYKKHEILKEKHARTSGALSQIELNRIKMETAQKDIERTQALGNYYLAYFRLLNSAGVENLDAAEMKKIRKRIKEVFSEKSAEEKEKIAEYRAEIKEYNTEIEKLNNKLEKLERRLAQKTRKIENNLLNRSKIKNEHNNRIENLKTDTGTKIKKLETQLASARSELNSTLKNLEQAEKDYYAGIKQKNREYKQLAANLEKKYSGLEEHIEQLENMYETCEDEYDSKLSEMEDSYEDKIDAKEEKLETAVDTREDIKDELEDLKDELNDIKSDLKNSEKDSDVFKAKSNEFQTLQKDIIAAERKLDSAEESVRFAKLAISDIKQERKTEIAFLKQRYTAKMKEIKENRKKAEDEYAETEVKIDLAEDEHDENLDKLEEQYETKTENLENKIDEIEEKCEKLAENLNEKKENSSEKLDDIIDNFEDNINNMIETAEEEKEIIKEHRSEISGIIKELEKLRDEKKKIVEKLEESEGIIDNHQMKLAKYVDAIKQYKHKNNTDNISRGNGNKSGRMGKSKRPAEKQTGTKESSPEAEKNAEVENISTAAEPAVTPDDNLNMEAQTQSGDDDISFLEYTPEATKNIQMQTQSNAGSDDISVMGYDPDTQDNVQMQMMNDAGNNQINFQEYGSKFKADKDKIGDEKMNKKINKQLSE